MRLVAISDTHGSHAFLKLPEGDMIVHAGDVSKVGSKAEIVDFLEWFGSLDYKHKVFIAGNHDFYFEKASSEEISAILPDGIHYLNDSGCTIAGFKIWGSPVQPWFYDWAFNRQRGAEIKEHWDKIPRGLDILITHGPPKGILDQTIRGESVGCEELIKAVIIQKPKFHIFGHIHEAYGAKTLDNVDYINSSVLNERYEMANEAIVLDL